MKLRWNKTTVGADALTPKTIFQNLLAPTAITITIPARIEKVQDRPTTKGRNLWPKVTGDGEHDGERDGGEEEQRDEEECGLRRYNDGCGYDCREEEEDNMFSSRQWHHWWDRLLQTVDWLTVRPSFKTTQLSKVNSDEKKSQRFYYTNCSDWHGGEHCRQLAVDDFDLPQFYLQLFALPGTGVCVVIGGGRQGLRRKTSLGDRSALRRTVVDRNSGLD